jgi:hypothetical protein
MGINAKAKLPTAAAVLAVLMLCGASRAADKASGADGMLVLDAKKTMWRCRMVRATNEFLMAPGKIERVMYRNKKGGGGFAKQKALKPGDYRVEKLRDYRLPEKTSTDWMNPDFDDSEWCRKWGATGTGGDPGWKLMLMRGHFEVSDPSM